MIMKKLIVLFLVAGLFSCSNDEGSVEQVSAKDQLSVLDGNMLSFRDKESFVKEYSDLAGLSTDELKSWISSKKVKSLLDTSDDSASMEEDELSESRIIYSDALKSILNSDSKVKVGGKVLWLNERTFYLLPENEINKTSEQLISEKGELKAYGSLLSVSKSVKSFAGRSVFPNENRIKTYVSDEMNISGSRLRHILDLYNETIVFNEVTQSSKMYLRSTLQYRSCSTFRCTWKEAMNARTIESNCGNTFGAWNTTGNIYAPGFSGAKTFLLSYWMFTAPIDSSTNFVISGSVNCYIDSTVPNARFFTAISWY